MKRYAFLVVSLVIAFVTLASSLLLPDPSNSADPLALVTKRPIRTPTKRPANVKSVLRQVLYFALPTQPAPGEQPQPGNAIATLNEREGPGVEIIAEDSELQVYNFQPSETIRVFHYDLLKNGGWTEILYTWTLVDWQEFVTGSDGSLRIKIDDIQDTYVVIGEKTGERNTDRGLRKIDSVVINSVVRDQSICPGSLISRLTVGLTARVSITTRIRQKSSPSVGILGRLPAGTIFSITAGPDCRSEVMWWYGRTDKGIEGWVAESQNDMYMLEPVQ